MKLNRRTSNKKRKRAFAGVSTPPKPVTLCAWCWRCSLEWSGRLSREVFSPRLLQSLSQTAPFFLLWYDTIPRNLQQSCPLKRIILLLFPFQLFPLAYFFIFLITSPFPFSTPPLSIPIHPFQPPILPFLPFDNITHFLFPLFIYLASARSRMSLTCGGKSLSADPLPSAPNPAAQSPPYPQPAPHTSPPHLSMTCRAKRNL